MQKKQMLRRKILLILTMVTSVIYIGWRMIYTIPTTFGLVSLIAGIALVVAETISFIEAFEHYGNMSRVVEPDLPIIPMDWYPEVDVLIATHNEPVELLYKTINGCMHMEYPDLDKVHIHLCDDNDRPEMKELADRMGIGYFGLSDNREAKAGNLNHALSKTQAPIVVTFDADMIPMHDFLLETVPYFFLPRMEKNEEGEWVEKAQEDTEKIGFIQTPQSFYNADLFQYNLHSESRIPNEQDYFFREVNIGRNRTNSAIYAGSNTLISREALEEVGGIKVGTITEDFATGIEIQSKGYRCYAVDKSLAQGLAPTSVISLIKQRERWGRGCVQTIRSRAFLLNGDLPIKTKLSYMASFMYWWTFMRRFIYIISPILFTVFHIHVVECSLWELILIWLPSYILYNHSLRVISGNIRNQRWSNIVDTIIFPYMIFPIMLETLGVKLRKFVVTKKDRTTSESESNLRFATPHLILIFFSLLGLYYSVQNAVLYGNFGNIIVIYWLCVNLFNLIMAVLFMLGRPNYRQFERIAAELPVTILTDQGPIEAVTSDLSESGLAISLAQLIPLQAETYDLELRNERNCAKFTARVVHVKSEDKKGKVSFELAEIDEENKREFFQIVFDQGHSYPRTMNHSETIFHDLLVNLKGRRTRTNPSNRKLQRIDLQKEFGCRSGKTVTLRNYNFKYFLIEGEEAGDLEYLIDLTIEKTMHLSLEESLSQLKPDGEWIYQLVNAEELNRDPRFLDLLQKWSGSGSELDEGDAMQKPAVSAGARP